MERALLNCSKCGEHIIMPFRIYFCNMNCYLGYLRKTSKFFKPHPWAN